jgi:DNA-nicking Smr family endonuclease
MKEIEPHEKNPDLPSENEDSIDLEEPVMLEIDGILDLHTFRPKEVADLLEDYLTACVEKDILDVRIIHGKGKGVLRDRVRSILKRSSIVESYEEAPLEAGGWGATIARLRSLSDD